MTTKNAPGKRLKSHARVPQQSRSEDAIAKIAKAVVSLLGSEGQGGVTHRRVAEVAGVSLATTTYYYSTKFDLIADAHTRFLDEYGRAFSHAKERHRAGQSTIVDLADLMMKAIKNAAGRHWLDTLAWSEIMFSCSRDRRGHGLALEWFSRMEKFWTDLLIEIRTDNAEALVNPAIDIVMGIGFITVPLNLSAEQISLLFREGRPLAEVCQDPAGSAAEKPDEPHILSPKSRETRNRIIDAAVTILESGETTAISYSTVAQRIGVTSAAPSYHFQNIEQLLTLADKQIMERMRDRCSEMLNDVDPSLNNAEATDLLATASLRSTLESGYANIAGIQAWVDAARKTELRPQLLNVLVDLQNDVTDFLKALNINATPRCALLLMGQFFGRLVRAMATGNPSGYLAQARRDFGVTLTALRGETNPFLPPQ